MNMTTVDDGLTWLPLPEAAARIGKTTDAVRSMVRRDKLRARKANDGGVLVGVPTVSDQSGDGLSTAVDQTAGGHATAELREELTEARVMIARLEERLEAVRAEAHAQVEAARAVAMADVATAKAETEAALRHIALLDDLLAEARRPWWRRLLG
jgi:hypothetical protein